VREIRIFKISGNKSDSRSYFTYESQMINVTFNYTNLGGKKTQTLLILENIMAKYRTTVYCVSTVREIEEANKIVIPFNFLYLRK
jgi:hypothetical protein